MKSSLFYFKTKKKKVPMASKGRRRGGGKALDFFVASLMVSQNAIANAGHYKDRFANIRTVILPDHTNSCAVQEIFLFRKATLKEP